MSSINAEQKNKSRRKFLMVIAVFALPIILAKLALEQGWLDYGVTNQGTLIENELTLNQLGLNASALDQQWLLLYPLPSDCQSHCEQALEKIHNTYVALGKEMPRVTPVALTQKALSAVQQKRISESQWHVLPSTGLTNNLLSPAQVFIVDPLGNIILSHSIPSDDKNLPEFGKAILADMKKLLKYSKVG